MKKKPAKLDLKRETVRVLRHVALTEVVGGIVFSHEEACSWATEIAQKHPNG